MERTCVGSGAEVFSRAERQRKCSDEDKARIVAELVASVDSVVRWCDGMHCRPQQLFGWRGQ
ncbi:transposase [Bradyrhizobium sp. BRP20]|nr:transposase [Bradyrhizobium sp. BRP20]MCA1551425.1 transposase [Bradyrhizobium sp. BRP19]